MKRIYIPILVVLLSVLYCEETVVLDVESLDEKVTIEGQLTDELGNTYVKVSTTRDFYFQGVAPRVTNAIIEVSDDLGNNFTFEHNPSNDPDLEGFYFPVNSLQGDVGVTYTLNVEIGSEHYSASETMLPVADIDSLGAVLDEDELDEPKYQEDFMKSPSLLRTARTERSVSL